MEPTRLAKKERMLLDALQMCEGTMVTRRYLFAYLYPDPRSRPVSIRSIDVLACRVRKWLAAQCDGENCIHKIWNEGYKLVIPNYC